MLNVKIILLGKLKEKYFVDACDEYIKRLSVFCKLELLEIDAVRLPENPSQAQIDKALDTEGQKILQKATGALFPLCIEGTELSSMQFSEKIQHTAQQGQGSITFVVGSSHGLSKEIKDKADFKLSMSKMTFPHQLARVMLLEQIYRAFTISTSGKYHK